MERSIAVKMETRRLLRRASKPNAMGIKRGKKMVEPIRIFIGYDQVEAAAFHTLCHSIWRRASRPVSITPIKLNMLRDYHNRDRDPMQSNEFAFTRWLVPFLCNYEGRAIFMDCDMLVLDDIAKLWNHFDPQYAVQVVKHNHVPEESHKYLGMPQSKYEKKNWSSVMLFNNAKCRALTPDYVNTAHGLDLHQFKWLEGDELVGDIPMRWNFLVDYYKKIPVEALGNIHYTIGGPYFKDYANCDYAGEWWSEYKNMTHVEQAAGILAEQHYSETPIKIK